MSDPVLVAVIGGGVATLAPMLLVIANRLAAIHTAVNSERTASLVLIQSLREENALLRGMLVQAGKLQVMTERATE